VRRRAAAAAALARCRRGACARAGPPPAAAPRAPNRAAAPAARSVRHHHVRPRHSRVRPVRRRACSRTWQRGSALARRRAARVGAALHPAPARARSRRWFNFRATEYLAKHGLSKFFTWFDHECVRRCAAVCGCAVAAAAAAAAARRGGRRGGRQRARVQLAVRVSQRWFSPRRQRPRPPYTRHRRPSLSFSRLPLRPSLCVRRSWYPLGRPVGTTIYPGMQMTSVFIWKVLKHKFWPTVLGLKVRRPLSLRRAAASRCAADAAPPTLLRRRRCSADATAWLCRRRRRCAAATRRSAPRPFPRSRACL
jgi:hypothetical protein